MPSPDTPTSIPLDVAALAALVAYLLAYTPPDPDAG